LTNDPYEGNAGNCAGNQSAYSCEDGRAGDRSYGRAIEEKIQRDLTEIETCCPADHISKHPCPDVGDLPAQNRPLDECNDDAENDIPEEAVQSGACETIDDKQAEGVTYSPTSTRSQDPIRGMVDIFA